MNLEQKLSELKFNSAPSAWRRDVFMAVEVSQSHSSNSLRSLCRLFYLGPRLTFLILSVWLVIGWLHFHTPSPDYQLAKEGSVAEFLAVQEERQQIEAQLAVSEDEVVPMRFAAPLTHHKI